MQFITLDQAERSRPGIARQWVRHLAEAIHHHDRVHLITVGLVDWSLDRPGLTSGFVPHEIASELDVLSVHMYPEAGQIDAALETLASFAVGKPVLIKETFPQPCALAEFSAVLQAFESYADRWIRFYWGKTPAEFRRSGHGRQFASPGEADLALTIDTPPWGRIQSRLPSLLVRIPQTACGMAARRSNRENWSAHVQVHSRRRRSS